MKNIELPRKVIVGDNAICEVDSLCRELGLTGRPLIIADETTAKIAGKTISIELSEPVTIVESNTQKIHPDGLHDYVIGVGGGRILDLGKIHSFENKMPFISVPTSASHDGIASPQASVKGEKPVSVQVHCPLGVVADTKIIMGAPRRLLASGAADAISNYTAVLDWQLAHREKGEYYGDYASALSGMSAEIIMESGDRIYSNISILVEALLSSGVAIGIAGSSRPASGAEHMISHALDMICEKPALHGEQCGLASIITAYLHEADWMRVRDSLRKVGAPITAAQLGLPGEKIIEAVSMAAQIRDRHTILRDGISEDTARMACEKTKVI
jgi:glycerol-1-phosphate dehydrogenase [NAD(P)+]